MAITNRSRHSSNAMPYISANRNPPNISHRKAFHVSAPHIAIAPRVRQPAAIALSRIRIGSIDVRMPTKNPRHTYERIASINASHNEMLMAEPTTPSCGISSTFASTAKASPIAFTMAHVRSIPLEIMTFASTIFMAEHITAIPTNRSGTADSAKSAPPSNATIGSASNISRAMIAEPNTITKFMFFAISSPACRSLRRA